VGAHATRPSFRRFPESLPDQVQADHQQPHKIWTFLNMVREALTNDF